METKLKMNSEVFQTYKLTWMNAFNGGNNAITASFEFLSYTIYIYTSICTNSI